MKNIDKCVLDLTNKLENAKYSEDKRNLLTAIEKLKEIQVLENAHEQEMERIKAMCPPPETMASVISRLVTWLMHEKGCSDGQQGQANNA